MSKQGYKKCDIPTLIPLAQGGDVKALEELIRRVQKLVYTMFSFLTNKNNDVADLTQETLLKMARSLYQLKDPKNFHSWLNQIITNLFYDYARKNSDKLIEFNQEKLKGKQ